MQFAPITLQALGARVRRRRLELGLIQKQAAGGLGVNPWTGLNLEKDHTEPLNEFMPAIITVPRLRPLLEPTTIPERLLAKRRAMDWSIREAAGQFG